MARPELAVGVTVNEPVVYRFVGGWGLDPAVPEETVYARGQGLIGQLGRLREKLDTLTIGEVPPALPLITETPAGPVQSVNLRDTAAMSSQAHRFLRLRITLLP